MRFEEWTGVTATKMDSLNVGFTCNIRAATKAGPATFALLAHVGGVNRIAMRPRSVSTSTLRSGRAGGVTKHSAISSAVTMRIGGAGRAVTR